MLGLTRRLAGERLLLQSAATQVDITAFRHQLVKRVEARQPLAASIKREADFEDHHVIAPAWQLATKNPGIFLCVHPAPVKVRCKPTCEDANEARQRKKGCSRCWADSKAWSVVQAWGLRHTFDLVARDKRVKTLAVEVKWLKFKGGKAPNSEFQRFIGQCVLATAVHDQVVGVCCVVGGRDRAFERHTKAFTRKLRKVAVRLVVLRVRSFP